MTVLASAADTRSAEFRANAERMRVLLDQLAERTAEAARGGPESAQQRHLSRGKLLPRTRVERLLDPGSPFLELSPLAGYGLHDGEVPAGGIITGVGRVSGRAGPRPASSSPRPPPRVRRGARGSSPCRGPRRSTW